MRHIFIVNPVAGKQDAGRMMEGKIAAAAKECGIDYTLELTKAPKHAAELAQGYAGSGEDVRLYAVGGDGTLNEVLSGAWPHKNAAVASIPCGSGNDFVRTFGTVEDFLDIPALIRGVAQDIDLMQVDGGICAAITSTGLDAEVAYNIPKYRRVPLLGGTMAYNMSILEKLLKPLGKTLRITINGRVQEGKYLIATVCNGQTYGGGYRAAPMASVTDGILDVILVKKIGRARLVSIIGKYKNGQHFTEGEILPEFRDVMEYYRATEVEIDPTGDEQFILNVDGECGPAPRLYAKVLPLAGRFVLPAALAER